MRIRELYLLSDDLKATEEFYTNLLQIPVLQRTTTRVSFMIGATMVCFEKSENENPVYHLAFDIPGNQLETAYQWLKQRVKTLPVTTDSDIADFTSWGARSVYFFDNNGNILELICRYHFNEHSAAEFSGSSFISVCEFGIVTNDVHWLTNKIIHDNGVELYVKQPPREDFAVLGTDAGLLILVSENRNWYPTEIKSKTFWSRIVFDAPNGSRHDMEITPAYKKPKDGFIQ